MNVQEALAAAEELLPGIPAPDGHVDPRWQAIIELSYFVEQEAEAVWPFVLKWGSHPDEDVRSAIATCLLEHLLESHFHLLFPRIETAAKCNTQFADTLSRCWKLGQAKEPVNAKKFDLLLADLRNPDR